jgi:pimeloyl-ACP methyl ester carboxylesterase
VVTARLVTTDKLNPEDGGRRLPWAGGRFELHASAQLPRAEWCNVIRKIFAIFGLLTLVSAAFIGMAYRRDIQAARARVSSGSQVVNTPCGLIEYADVGKGAPVLVVHGAAGGFDQGLDIGQPFFVEHGFRVIAVSRFGYLRTPMPADGSPPAQADAYACLLDALKIKQAVVFAVSAGGPSAMQFCLRHRERCAALVLFSAAAFAPLPAGETQARRPRLVLFLTDATLHSDSLFWAVTKLPRNMLLKSFLGTPPEDFERATPEEQAGALKAVGHLLPIRERANGMENDLTVVSNLPRYALERISMPTLVIAAEDEPVWNVRRSPLHRRPYSWSTLCGLPNRGTSSDGTRKGSQRGNG